MCKEKNFQTSTLLNYIASVLGCGKSEEFHPVGIEVSCEASLCTRGGAGSATENVQVYSHYQTW